jgi:hypothetical protein
MDEASAQGAGGTIDDLLVLLRPWGFDVADIAVPARLMAARDDRGVPLSHHSTVSCGDTAEHVSYSHRGMSGHQSAISVSVPVSSNTLRTMS